MITQEQLHKIHEKLMKSKVKCVSCEKMVKQDNIGGHVIGSKVGNHMCKKCYNEYNEYKESNDNLH